MAKRKAKATADNLPTCGIIMPISEIDGCPASHWVDVKKVLYESIRKAKFEPQLVSDSDDARVIQGNIVQNLFANEIVVCDVSGKNSNVMFELGLRLAADKPVVIIKDDKTDYSFDTSPIEHLGYPRDLRYHAIQEFKATLTKKIAATHEASREQKDYSPFLRHFVSVKPSHLPTQELPPVEYFERMFETLEKQIAANRAPAPSEPLDHALSGLAREAMKVLKKHRDHSFQYFRDHTPLKLTDSGFFELIKTYPDYFGLWMVKDAGSEGKGRPGIRLKPRD